MNSSGDGLVNILQNMFATVRGLIVMTIVLVALIFVVMTWMRTRSLVPTLGAVVLGALVAWAAGSFGFFAENIGRDVQHFDRNTATETGPGFSTDATTGATTTTAPRAGQ